MLTLGVSSNIRGGVPMRAPIYKLLTMCNLGSGHEVDKLLTMWSLGSEHEVDKLLYWCTTFRDQIP